MKKQTEKYYKDNLRVSRICNLVMFICLVFMFGCFLSLFHIRNEQVSYKIQETNTTITYPEINFQNLSENQINEIYSITDRIKYYYLLNVNNITFVGENDYLPCNFSWECNVSGAKVLGFNYRNGHIVVRYDKNLTIVKDTICHELAHNIIIRNEYEEDYADDFGRGLQCFFEPKSITFIVSKKNTQNGDNSKEVTNGRK